MQQAEQAVQAATRRLALAKRLAALAAGRPETINGLDNFTIPEDQEDEVTSTLQQLETI